MHVWMFFPVWTIRKSSIAAREFTFERFFTWKHNFLIFGEDLASIVKLQLIQLAEIILNNERERGDKILFYFDKQYK